MRALRRLWRTIRRRPPRKTDAGIRSRADPWVIRHYESQIVQRVSDTGHTTITGSLIADERDTD